MHFFTRFPTLDAPRYTFTDGHFMELEDGDTVDQAYAAGYLPASHLLEEPPRQFYRARSLRLDLQKLTFNKKRRYLQRRGELNGLAWNHGPAAEVLKALPQNWKELTLDWVRQRFDPPYMNSKRLDYVCSHLAFNQLGYVTKCGELVAVVILPIHTNLAHYWFAFLDLAAASVDSLGRWCMGAAAIALRDSGHSHLYLGTAYNLTAAYKFKGVAEGVEWFDGQTWRTDRSLLKAQLRSDSPPS